MTQKKKILLVAGLALLLAAFLTAFFVLRPQASLGAKTLTVTIDHLNADDRTLTLHTDAAYLRGAMEEQSLIGGTEGEFGLYLLTVDGETADESKQEWWGYTVNGELALYGVDEQPVQDGDTIVFTLNVGW